ncbi:ATPase AAA [Sporomusaceae bacterium FL31]|nr:ATPase AAA [Sporomusaceae bacterium FL31]GCE33199.1 ATPase AAA [Sporomusaceae bacterium]
MKTVISNIAHIQSFVQEYAETITDVLELAVTIIDEECIRIGGTGPHAESIGRPIPCGSFFRQVIASGQPGLIYDQDGTNVCQNCDTSFYCQELATMGFPISKQGQIVGVIGVIAFTAEQKDRLVGNSEKFLSFLRHMSSLLESKLLMLDDQWRLQNQVQEVLETVNQTYVFGTMLGRDKNFIQFLQKAERVATSNSTILIRGESGTGKELLAKALHAESARSQQPFVVVNCPSIPANLLESELFGYESGAFTGANKAGKKGKFELADKGTIFLDEIGDLPIALQPKLLRVIQERSVERVGSAKPLSLDVRIIAATNRDLEKMVREGQFREDLYYRLNVIPLTIPPLRLRPVDIPLYIECFLIKFTKELKARPLKMDEALRRWLMNYYWPGNVRQLEHVIEYMVNIAKGEVLTLQELPTHLISNEGQSAVEAGLDEQLADYEKQLLRTYVESGATLADKKQAAERLKISLATLYRKLEKYQL